jgi:hypothetical protein
MILIGCNTQQPVESKAKTSSKLDSLKNALLGRWGGLGEESPVWEITMDSIYYFQELKSYRYEILNNNFIIYRQESKGILKNISVIKDTMTFYHEDGLKVTGYRFRSN